MDAFGICIHPYVPIRAEASEGSEMISQLVFGEVYSILDVNNHWLNIRTDFDSYKGWINRSQSLLISKKAFLEYREADNICFQPFNRLSCLSDSTVMTIPIGSFLPTLNNGMIYINSNTYIFEGQSISYSVKPVKSFLHYAHQLMNTPYLWGGRSSFGMDCSGFTQLIYKLGGISLPRDSSMQAKRGETISFLTDAIPGDLLFFDNEDGTINHVGIYKGNEWIIHASGSVREDRVDHHGIFRDGVYSHKLRLIKRIIN